MESHRPFYKEDFTAWMLDTQEAQVELETIEATEKAVNDELRGK
jgi:hypothetical protein